VENWTPSFVLTAVIIFFMPSKIQTTNTLTFNHIESTKLHLGAQKSLAPYGLNTEDNIQVFSVMIWKLISVFIASNYCTIVAAISLLIEWSCLVVEALSPAVHSSIFLSNNADLVAAEVEVEAWDNRFRLKRSLQANKYTIHHANWRLILAFLSLKNCFLNSS
jgi:hypothetical protein